jgi:2Fe-2S ferredoxin
MSEMRENIVLARERCSRPENAARLHEQESFMAVVTYIQHNGEQQKIDVPDGDSVMQGAVRNNLPGIVGECGGALACATCHCYVDEAWTGRVGGPASPEERDMLEIAAAEVRPNSRLGCQIVVSDALDGLVVHTPENQY